MKPAAEDPLIRALFERLPAPNELWSVPSRVRWLNSMAAAFSLLYMPADAPEIRATVKDPQP